MSLREMRSIIAFVKAFLGKEGGIFIDTHIKSHHEGTIKPFEEDIWILGEIDRPITFEDIETFILKVEKLVTHYEKKGTYIFESISLINNPLKKYRAKFDWAT